MYEYVKKRDPLRQQSEARTRSGRSLTVVRKVPIGSSKNWLKQGVNDVVSSRWLSLFYGSCFVLMGLGVERAHAGNPALALGLSAGFLFMGPFMFMGLYELSRQIRAQERIDFLLSLFSWGRNPAAIGRFALFLSVVMVIWLWLSIRLMVAVGDVGGIGFLGTLLVWMMLALLVFMASAIAIPMLLDRPVSAAVAIRTSIRCFIVNPVGLGLWAVVVALMVGVSLLLNYWPLLALGPILGHASWHACQACLEGSNRK